MRKLGIVATLAFSGIIAGAQTPTGTSGGAAAGVLPSQTNQSGKILTTNGTAASWANVLSPPYAGAGLYSNALCATAPSPITSVTPCFTFGTAGEEAGELTLQSSSTNNVLELLNTNSAGFSVITASGPDAVYAGAHTNYEHGAFGYQSTSGSYGPNTFMECSRFDFSGNALLSPTRCMIFQSGGVDPTGGTNYTCSTSNTSAALTCAANSTTNGQRIVGVGVPTETVISSGGGTTSITMSKVATSTNASEQVNFATPVYAQYPVFDLTDPAANSNSGQIFIKSWNLSNIFTINRNNSGSVGIGAIPTFGVPAALLEVGGTEQIDGTHTLKSTTNQACYDYTAPTTGTTYTPAAGKCFTVIEPAGTIATLTVNMPASPVSGQIYGFVCMQAVTTLTVSANGNVFRGGTTPTSCSIGQTFQYIFHVNTVWYPYSH